MRVKRKPDSGARLRRALQASHAFSVQIRGAEFPLAEFEALQSFQRHRLADSYADLAAQERYCGAVEFFLDELYGGLHFRERDQQVEQVLPVMLRLLPSHMLDALGDALRLQELSIALDIQLCHAMQAGGLTDLDERSYGTVYRTVSRSAREEQLELIRHLGNELCDLVRHRSVLLLIRVMRGPAHAAGFGALQGFLERGLAAFRAMGESGPDFIRAIHERETAVMERLYGCRSEPFTL